MAKALRDYLDQQAAEIDASVRDAIDACGGNVMQALRVTIIANTFLIEENEKLRGK